jgi:hypothetical protein
MNFNSLPFPWIDSPNIEQLLQESHLSSDEQESVRFFAEYGYLIVDPEIENFNDLAAQVIEELAPVYTDKNRPNGGSDKARLQDAWYFNECSAVQAIAIAPKIIRILSLLYQRSPIPFQTLNFPVGTQQKTHSDTIHFHSIPRGFMCGVWVALEDIDEFNGPLHYYPKSHKLPILGFDDLGIKTYQEYEYYIEEIIQQLNLKKISLHIKKGMALIWSANLLHGGNPIIDKTRTRHTQVTHYYFSDCLYYSPMVTNPITEGIKQREVINIATGEIVPPYYYGQYHYELDSTNYYLQFPFKDRNSRLVQKKHDSPQSLLMPHDFDALVYYQLNPDVALAKMDAKQHYIQFGIKEGRRYK